MRGSCRERERERRCSKQAVCELCSRRAVTHFETEEGSTLPLSYGIKIACTRR